MLTSSTSTHSKTTHSASEEPQSADSEPGTSRAQAVVLAAEVATWRGEAVVLTPGRWGVGSADGNQIVIDHETVSPRHAMIIVTEHRVLVTSWARGTYVNGERCRESLLCPGDILTIGTVDLKLRAADSSELISHLPDVNSAANHSTVIHIVSADETLRRLDDLDTALALLDEELAGDDDSSDQLNELIEQIEADIAHRSEVPTRQPETDILTEDQSGELSWNDVTDGAATEQITGETVAEDASRSHSLDELMSEVVPSQAEAQLAFSTVESQFVNDAEAGFAADENLSEAEEFSQLVGSTSVLAQNLTLNALRSRAEAVRQLDEMILAASRDTRSFDRATTSDSTATPAPGRSATSASGNWSEEPESDPNAGQTLTESSSYSETEDAADDNGFFDGGSSPEETAADGDWLADDDSQTDAEPEATESDTVEFSAIDTVNEAGSLLASLFREEAGEPIELPTDAVDASLNSDCALASATDADSEPTAIAEQFPTATEVSETRDVEESGEDVSGVRSRLAEMFGLPGLTSASPKPFEADGHLDATENDSDFDSPDAELQSDPFEQDDDASYAAPAASTTNLTTWLDGVKSNRSATVEESSNFTSDAEEAGSASEYEVDSQAEEVMEPSASAREESGAPTDGDDSVAAYMQALLARNRVRHGQPERPEAYVVLPTASAPETGSESASESAETNQDAAEAREQVSNGDLEASSEDESQSWLSQSPKHQLDKDRVRADTQALREVANETARCAVTRASRRQLKVQVVVKTTASVVMLGCGVAASLLGVSTMFAALVMAVGAYFAFDLALTIVRNWKCITA